MNYAKAVLIMIEMICGLLLVITILLQRAKNEGLGLAFGSQMGESLFGAGASNVLVKATIWLGIIFLVNTTVLAKLYYKGAERPLISESSVPVPVERQVPPPSGQSAAEPVKPDATPPAPLAPQTPAPLAPLTAAPE